MATTTKTQVANFQANWLAPTLLPRNNPKLVHSLFGQKSQIPLHESDAPKYRRYNALAVGSLIAKDSITDPTALQLSVTDITGDLVSYGGVVAIKDQLLYTEKDHLTVETLNILRDQASLTLDTLYREKLFATTSVYNAGGVAAKTDIVSGIATADFDKIVRSLLVNKSKFWSPRPSMASDGVGTKIVLPAYFAIISPTIYYDLVKLTGWKYAAEYSDTTIMEANEVGSLGQIRFVMSDNAKVVVDAGGDVGTTGLASDGGSKVDVHSIFIFGKDAYGITPLKVGTPTEHGNVEVIITDKKDNTSSATRLFGTWAWKAYTDLQLLNENNMVRYDVGVTA